MNNFPNLSYATLNKTLWVSDRKTIWEIRTRIKTMTEGPHFTETVLNATLNRNSIEN